MPQRDFLQEQIEAISLVATWMNARQDLDPEVNFTANNFTLLAFSMVMDSWSAEVACTLIGDTLFKVTYDPILQEYHVAQFRRVEAMSIAKASLEGPNG